MIARTIPPLGHTRFAMHRQLARIIPQTWRNRLRAWQLRAAARWQGGRSLQPASPEVVAPWRADCPLCGTTQAQHTVIGDVPLTHPGPFTRDDYRLVHCSSCDSIYLQPLPADIDLATLYERSAQFGDVAHAGSPQGERILQMYGRRLDRLSLVPAAGESVLEVGAGPAWISRVCKQRRADVRTVAQDVSAECADRCPWVDDYHWGAIDGIPAAAQFSLVSMTHVIEHLVDPRSMLRKIQARTRIGGHLYVTAPYRPPLWKSRDGLGPWLAYSYLHVPAHISYLSERWFRKIAPVSGFDLVHWDGSHDGHQVFEAVLLRRD